MMKALRSLRLMLLLPGRPIHIEIAARAHAATHRHDPSNAAQGRCPASMDANARPGGHDRSHIPGSASTRSLATTAVYHEAVTIDG